MADSLVTQGGHLPNPTSANIVKEGWLFKRGKYICIALSFMLVFLLVKY